MVKRGQPYSRRPSRVVSQWAKALNLWKEEQVAQWAAQPGWTPGREGVTGERGGDGIMEYVIPTTERAPPPFSHPHTRTHTPPATDALPRARPTAIFG